MGKLLKRIVVIIVGIITALVLFGVALVVTLSIWVGSLMSSPTTTLERGTLLEISMNDLIVDSPASSSIEALRAWALNTPQEISMLDLAMTIEFAAADPNITALSLRMDGDQALSLAAAAELREMVEDFKRLSGKPVYAYAESYSQVEYLLASVADSLYLHPQGLIEWQGVAANGLYFGGLFEELGIKAEVFRPAECTYKSAVEPYTSTEMSPQSREQNQRLVTSLWEMILEQVSASRDISVAALRDIAREQIIVEPLAALESGMASALAYRDEYDADLEELGVVVESNGALRSISMGAYVQRAMQQIDNANSSLVDGDNKVAVIYIDGTIVDGDLRTLSRDVVVSGDVARQLRRARLDEDVRAVIVRVNSPGGSALAADVIWREMELVRGVKPLIVSFGAYAASGGYYVSAPADLIITSPYTLTGSIGVYGVMFAYEDALRNKLKISTDGVLSSPSADFGRVAREVTPIERAAMMRSVDNVYTTFQSCVIRGRHLSAEEVARLSGGRVWCGEEAVELGLADGVGGIRKALLLASERCGLGSEGFEIVEYGGGGDDWDSFINEILFGASANNLLTDVRELFELHRGVMMLSPERVEF